MFTRTKKQIGYGLGFLAVFALIVWAIASRFTTPAAPPVAASPTPQFLAVQVEEVSTVAHAPVPPALDRTVDIVVRLRNPNLRAGITEYPVSLVLHGRDDHVLEKVTASTYLLPSAVSYVIKLGVPVASEVSRVEVALPANPAFVSVPASVTLPSFSWSARERSVREIGSIPTVLQKGVVTNTSGLDWQFVEVAGVAENSAGEVVGVGQTFVGELKVGEQREFTLQWPAILQDIQNVIVLATTNIYKQENIVRAIGDPSLLR